MDRREGSGWCPPLSECREKTQDEYTRGEGRDGSQGLRTTPGRTGRESLNNLVEDVFRSGVGSPSYLGEEEKGRKKNVLQNH